MSKNILNRIKLNRESCLFISVQVKTSSTKDIKRLKTSISNGEKASNNLAEEIFKEYYSYEVKYLLITNSVSKEGNISTTVKNKIDSSLKNVVYEPLEFLDKLMKVSDSKSQNFNQLNI